MVNAVSKTSNAGEASLLYGGFIFLITGLICFGIAVTPSSTISERQSEIVIGENGDIVHGLPDIEAGDSIGFECHFRTYLPPDSNDSFSVYVLDRESYETLHDKLTTGHNLSIRDIITDMNMIHTAEGTDDFHFHLLFHEDEDIYIVMINNGIEKRLIITIEVDDGPPKMSYLFMSIVLVAGSILLFLSFSSLQSDQKSGSEINKQIQIILDALSDTSLDMEVRVLWCQPLKDQIKWGRVDDIVTAEGILKLIKTYNRSEGTDKLEFASVLALIADSGYFRTVLSSGGAPALVSLIENGSWTISESAISYLQEIDRILYLSVFLACIRSRKEHCIESLLSNDTFTFIAGAMSPDIRVEHLLRGPLENHVLHEWPYQDNIGSPLDHITFALHSSIIVSLIRALEDPEDESEEEIFPELGNMMGEGMETMLVITGSLPYLVRSLCDPVPDIRERIHEILIYIAETVPNDILQEFGAARIFNEALNDQDEFTRSVASEVMEVMDGTVRAES